jgi:hypothetical protein
MESDEEFFPYGKAQHGKNCTPASKVSQNNRPGVFDPDDHPKYFVKQFSFGFRWGLEGGDVVTNHRSCISAKDAELLCYVEQVHKEERDKIVAENLDLGIDEFTDAQLTRIQSAVETRLADRFDHAIKTAERGGTVANSNSHFFVVPDDGTLYQLEIGRGCKKVKENGHWNLQSLGIVGAMERHWNPPPSAAAAPINEVDDVASASWGEGSSESGDESETSAEDSGNEVWQDAEEGDGDQTTNVPAP